MLVDTHAHLFWDSYTEDLQNVIKNAVDAGVGAVINVGVDVDLSLAATKQAKLQTKPDFKMYSAIAIHPEDGIKYWEKYTQARSISEDIAALEKIYLDYPETVIGIGECGLDFSYFDRASYLPEGLSVEEAKNLQRQLFRSQIDLAKKLNLPILIHCRDDRSKNSENTECWDEVVELTKDHFGIYHCYSGLLPTTKSILQNTDFLLSFAGNLTYPKNDYLKEAVKITPLDRIILETDCPFLPPQSIRGKRNEPSSVREIAQFIAEIKETSFDEVAKQTTGNFFKLFKLQS